MRKGEITNIRIVHVVDGDSLVVAPGSWFPPVFARRQRVRLFGIDAPEYAQPLGPEATAYLTSIVGGRALMKVVDIDRYDRLVALVFKQRLSESVNARMIRDGYAYYYRRYGDQSLGFDNAEKEARDRRAGVWRDVRSERPWVYRARMRSKATGLGNLKRFLLALAVIIICLFILALWSLNLS